MYVKTVLHLLIISVIFSVAFSENASEVLDDDGLNKEFEDHLKLLLNNSSLDFLFNLHHEIPTRHESALPVIPRYNGNVYSSDETIIKANRHFDPWSIVWYVGSFGGLVIFFLVVSCSEWCCRRDAAIANSLSNRGQRCRLHEGYVQSQQIPETPPPAYHLFAPPSYESVYKDCVVYKDPNPEARQNHTVFVVPVHGSTPTKPKNDGSTIINMEHPITMGPR